MKDQDWKLWIHYHYYLTRAILVVGAGILLIMIGILPTINKMVKTRKRLKSEEAKLKEVTSKIVVIDNLDPNIVEQRVRLLDMVLPPSKDVVIYLNTLNSLARELNLSLGDISLSPGIVYKEEGEQKKSKAKVAKKSETWEDLETEIRIIGSRDNIYTFLKQIENIIPLMVMKDVQISRVGQGTDDSFVLSLKLGMVYAEPNLALVAKKKISLLNQDDEKLLENLKNLRSYPIETSISNGGTKENSSLKDVFKSTVSIRSINQSLPLQPESSQSAQSSPSAQTNQ